VAEIAFTVSETGDQFKITAQVKGVIDLAGFLYWALDHGSAYRVAPAADLGNGYRHIVGLYPVGSSRAEPDRCLYTTLESGLVFWLCECSTYTLTHNALASFPLTAIQAIRPTDPIFRVEAAAGLFAMSLQDWHTCARSGEDSKHLIGLSFISDRPAYVQSPLFKE
jgi:hypothetical protein